MQSNRYADFVVIITALNFFIENLKNQGNWIFVDRPIENQALSFFNMFILLGKAIKSDAYK